MASKPLPDYYHPHYNADTMPNSRPLVAVLDSGPVCSVASQMLPNRRHAGLLNRRQNAIGDEKETSWLLRSEVKGYVHIHAGLHGIGDMDAGELDWRNSVAKITIARADD